MVSLETQLRNPWVLLTLFIYAALAVAPLAAWRGAPWKRRWLALAAIVVVTAASLPGWYSTPDGVLQDTTYYARDWGKPDRSDPAWHFLFGGTSATHVMGWNVFLVYLGWRLTGTWLIERFLGLVWHNLFAVAVCTLPLTPLFSLPMVVAITSVTPFGLWLQRHHAGSEILLQQVLLLACLFRARKQASWIIPAGLLTALLQYGYLAGMAALAYPAVILAWRWETVGAYAVAALAYIPAALTWSDVLVLPGTGKWNATWTLQIVGRRIWNLIAAFWDPHYSQDASWFWSYPGGQQLPPVACGCIVAGIVCALWSGEGRRWVLLAIAGLVPCLLGDTLKAASHREMMALLPLAVLAAWPLRLLPPRAAWIVGVVCAGVIAVTGLWEWHDPQFWAMWVQHAPHGF